jgi:hypothetical protein
MFCDAEVCPSGWSNTMVSGREDSGSQACQTIEQGCEQTELQRCPEQDLNGADGFLRPHSLGIPRRTLHKWTIPRRVQRRLLAARRAVRQAVRRTVLGAARQVGRQAASRGFHCGGWSSVQGGCSFASPWPIGPGRPGDAVSLEIQHPGNEDAAHHAHRQKGCKIVVMAKDKLSCEERKPYAGYGCRSGNEQFPGSYCKGLQSKPPAAQTRSGGGASMVSTFGLVNVDKG